MRELILIFICFVPRFFTKTWMTSGIVFFLMVFDVILNGILTYVDCTPFRDIKNLPDYGIEKIYLSSPEELCGDDCEFDLETLKVKAVQMTIAGHDYEFYPDATASCMQSAFFANKEKTLQISDWDHRDSRTGQPAQLCVLVRPAQPNDYQYREIVSVETNWFHSKTVTTHQVQKRSGDGWADVLSFGDIKVRIVTPISLFLSDIDGQGCAFGEIYVK